MERIALSACRFNGSARQAAVVVLKSLRKSEGSQGAGALDNHAREEFLAAASAVSHGNASCELDEHACMHGRRTCCILVCSSWQPIHCQTHGIPHRINPPQRFRSGRHAHVRELKLGSAPAQPPAIAPPSHRLTRSHFVHHLASNLLRLLKISLG